MIGKRLYRSFIRLCLLVLCLLTTKALAGALLRSGRNLARIMTTICKATSSFMQRLTG